jgi:hypothetical protein
MDGAIRCEGELVTTLELEHTAFKADGRFQERESDVVGELGAVNA